MKFVLLITLLLIVFYFTAYKARPAKNQHGRDINPPKSGFTKEKNSLSIGTYNVQSGKDINGKRDISRSADIIKAADIVGINEVYAASWLGSKNQAQALAEHSDFGWLFAATRRRWFREHRGNALLSRFPVNNWSIEMLPDTTGKQYRNLVTAFINFNGHEVAILVTHLHTKEGREQQLACVLEKFQQHDHAVLMGDMNTAIDHPIVQSVLVEGSFIDAIASSPNDSDCENDENSRIDWILTKGFTTVSSKFEPIGISDHPYYQVELSIDAKT